MERRKSLYDGMKGRRVLQFGNSNATLLKGKSIYLDLHGYKRASYVESGLKERGAAIERFFTKDTRYLVSNKTLGDQDKHSSSPHTPSSGVLCNVNAGSFRGSHPALSPFSANSPDASKTTLVTYSRTRNIVAAAKKMNSSGTKDIISLAKSWGIKIIPVEEILKYFSKYPVSAEDSAYTPVVQNLSTVRKLKEPYLKCEDVSRQYKPLVHEVKKWPVLNFNCEPDESPFDVPQKHRKSDVKERTEKTDKKNAGYCECCGVHFDDFDLHIKGDQHVAFAGNPSNYGSLDALHSTIPTLEQFVTSHKQRMSDDTIKSQEQSQEQINSSPVKYTLLCYHDTDVVTMVDDTNDSGCVQVEEDHTDVSRTPDLTDDAEKEFTPGFFTPMEHPKSILCFTDATSSNTSTICHNKDCYCDVTPNAKRYKRSDTLSPKIKEPVSNECRTPPKSTTPLKNFSILLYDSLKSPSPPTSVGKLSSPIVAARQLSMLEDIQSPNRCSLVLQDVMKSPTMKSPPRKSPLRNTRSASTSPPGCTSKRILRSASLSPSQINNASRDVLMDSPVKDDRVQTNVKEHVIMSPRGSTKRDILMGSAVDTSQTTPQKIY